LKSHVEVIQPLSSGKTGAVRTAVDHVSTPYMLFVDDGFTDGAEYIQRFLNVISGSMYTSRVASD
jgi:hypothetical protein